MLSLNEILNALGPCWRYANETDIDGNVLRPDYRKALEQAWEDIVVAANSKRESKPSINLNVAMRMRETV